MNLSACSIAGESCAGGLGQCMTIGGPCVCTDPGFEDTGDLKRSTNCAVHVGTYRVLWSMIMAMFASDIVLGLAAVAWMKRKRRQAERSELQTTWFHIMVAVFGLVLAALQFSPSADQLHLRRIGIDPATSFTFAFYILSTYVGALAKPIIKSEVSIARFALVRTHRGLGLFLSKYYSQIIAVFLLVLGISSFAPVVASFIPHLEAEMIMVYGVSYARVLTLCLR